MLASSAVRTLLSGFLVFLTTSSRQPYGCPVEVLIDDIITRMKPLSLAFATIWTWGPRSPSSLSYTLHSRTAWAFSMTWFLTRPPEPGKEPRLLEENRWYPPSGQISRSSDNLDCTSWASRTTVCCDESGPGRALHC
ncbi:hypothetical protein BDP81DRAFT_432174 [Colletotrichum phormii]|uniref:Secreted protein n=1 Tax=Colletotrichum phormii TaxID=359342 RepID=A0AAJ0EFE1_9PEZI|nr:uncharacterized protein BDP81DRAFT_432174 [Colletotrichum phormii]KAK1634885.1 hypothetical protein BDP81DRAFT_432174 [Colletotrichum phormii]